MSFKKLIQNKINNDNDWKKAQKIAEELIGGKLSLISSSSVFTDGESLSDVCEWLWKSPSGIKRCKQCISQNCFDAEKSDKSQVFRCFFGLTHISIKLSPYIAALSSPVICDNFNIDHYIQYAEEFGLSSHDATTLLSKLQNKVRINENQLQIILDLLDSLLAPLKEKISDLLPDEFENEESPKQLSDIPPEMEQLHKPPSPPTIMLRRKIEGRRAVITGIGIVSPIGIGKEDFLDGVLKAKNGISRISFFDPSDLPSQMAGQVSDFDPSLYMDRKTIIHTARSSQFAIVGTQMALEDAKIIIENEDPDRFAVIIGAGTNGIEYAAEQCQHFFASQGKKPVSPYTGVIVFAGACSGEVSLKFGLRGLSHTISTGCASSNDAIGSALRFIRNGEADCVITGGTDAAIIPITVSAFASMRALSTRNESPEKASRPFDKERDGFILGEGAAIFLMEEFEHALMRGAHIYAEVLGYGATNDAYHITKPAPDGVAASRAVYLALADAGLSPSDIEYVNAHGSSTPLNDKTETMISRMVFGKHAFSDKFAMSSIKSQIGHALGAASAMGLAASLLGMEYGFIPATINYKVFDSECDLNYIPNAPQYRTFEFFLSNAFAFTGKNSCLILGKFLEK